MARGTVLSELVTQLRLETGRSSTATANADEEAELKYKLRRIQAFYYDDYDWPHFNVFRPISLVQNERFYSFPSDMNLESAANLWVKENGEYVPMPRGIGMSNYNSYDSLLAVAATGTVTVTAGTSSTGVNMVTSVTVNGVEVLGANVDHTGDHSTTAAAIATQINTYSSSPEYYATSSGAVVTIAATATAGTTANTFAVSTTVAGDVTATDVALAGGVNAEQSDPVQKWEIRENDETDTPEIEVWPVPSEAGTAYLVGKRNLSALVLDADTADLDDQLLVLTLAAEMLAGAKKDNAAAIAAAAQRRYAQLKIRSKAGNLPFLLRGGVPAGSKGATVRVSG